MKSNFLVQLFKPLCILLVCLIFSTSSVAFAADYTSLISQAREQLQDEHFEEALASAKDAVRANAKDYKGHYYVAMAYMGMERFDEAEAAVARTRSLAPASAKAGVEKLASTIKTRRQGAGSVQAADTALADGLAGKAARLYEEAWSAGKDKPELGLKAAEIYANRLSQPLDAGRVLRQVSVAAKGSPAADKADAELKKLANTLRQAANIYVKKAETQQGSDALNSLQMAEDADPSYEAIYKLRARLAAQGDSAEKLQNAIKDLARRGLAKPVLLAGLPRMAQWMQQPAINEFLTDMLGSKKVDDLRTLAQNPPPEAGLIFYDCSNCPVMVTIEAGEFKKETGNVVRLDAFAIGQMEVTQGQWKAVMGSNPSYYKDCGDTCPVEEVNWNDAQEFIRKLNDHTGKQYRLPSEAEWEFACRAGSQQKYCGGDNVDSVAWHADNSGDKPHLAGQKQANAWGLYDMSGNVWEWVQDCYEGDCAKRVLRGGSWVNIPHYARAAFRGWNDPAIRFNNYGFRLARTLP